MDSIVVVLLVVFVLFILRNPSWLVMWANWILQQRVHQDNSTARVHEQALLNLLERDYPGIQGHIHVLLRRSHVGWECIANNSHRVYTWGAEPNLGKMSRMLKDPVLEHMRDVKARELALQILGRVGMQEVETGMYVVHSGFNTAVRYRFSPYEIILYRNNQPYGSFCLIARGRYPLWDVVLSRILMLQGSERDFLRTAHYYGSVPPYFARPMTRDQFAIIYGEEALTRWDSYTFSTLTPVTKR